MATEKGSRGAGKRTPPTPAKAKPSPPDPAALVAKHLGQIDEKVNRALERKAAMIDRKAAQLDRRATQLDRASAKIEGTREMLDRLSGHLGALEVWTRAEPGGRRPRFTRDEIAATAVRIADAEGFDAVSMRRLATDLGAGTMTLYHYVRTKDELLTLISDAVMAEVVVPPDEGLPPHWRDAVTVIAQRTRATMLRHPWILDITDDPPFGPNAVRHFDQTLEAVSSLPIGVTDKLDVVNTVDEYVFGYCLQERNNSAGEELGNDGMVEYVNGLLATGEYPQLAALVAEHGLDDTWSVMSEYFTDQGRFERNLARVLDGLQASLGLPPEPA
jgi:AcrR family transcriptional regulator